MPLVSIITCTFNRAHLIGETVRSVLDQTFSDFEYLIVDDGSTDHTDSVVNGFNDSRIRYFRLPNTHGHLSKLRNFGIRNSNGKYIAFVDSDDLWMRDKLQQQVVALEEDETLSFSFTDVETFDSDGVLKPSLYGRSGVLAGSIFDDFIQNKFVVCATTLLFRKACLERIGDQDERLLSGDFDFILSLATHFNAFAIFKPLVRVRKHDQNFTRRLPVHKAEGILASYQRLCDQGIVKEKKLRRTLGRLCYSFGVEFVRQGDHGFATRFFRKSMGFDFLYWKSYPRLIMAALKLNF